MDSFIYCMGLLSLIVVGVYSGAALLVWWAFHSAFNLRRKS